MELFWSHSWVECTRIYEPSEPERYQWGDNYLCVPRDTPYHFTFSYYIGRILGKGCILMEEPSDPYNWYDNYLCAAIEAGPSL